MKRRGEAMNCKDIREFLTTYLDGEVTSEEREQIRAHLSACPRCREELEALAITRHNLRQALKLMAAKATPSPQAWARLRQRLEAEQTKITIWSLAKSKLKGVIDIIMRGLVSRQPVWKTALGSALAIALIIGLTVGLPSLNGQSSEALAAEIAENSPQVKAALGDEEIEVVRVIKIVDDEGTVICEGTTGRFVTAKVDLEAEEVTEVKVAMEIVEMPELSDADEQEAISIAKADPEVQELLDQGATIGEVFPIYAFGTMTNLETGETEECSETMTLVRIELGERSWAARIDLTEGKVVRLIETTPGAMESYSDPEGKYEIHYFEGEEGPVEEPVLP